MRLPSTVMLTGPVGGAPVPSISMTPRIVSVLNGPSPCWPRAAAGVSPPCASIGLEAICQPAIEITAAADSVANNRRASHQEPPGRADYRSCRSHGGIEADSSTEAHLGKGSSRPFLPVVSVSRLLRENDTRRLVSFRLQECLNESAYRSRLRPGRRPGVVPAGCPVACFTTRQSRCAVERSQMAQHRACEHGRARHGHRRRRGESRHRCSSPRHPAASGSR